MNKKTKELNTVYWTGLVVPFVICILVLASGIVILTSNVGKPHPAVGHKIPTPNVLIKR